MKIFLHFLLIVIFPFHTYSQSTISDSLIVSAPLNKAIQFYRESMKENLALYNGSEYEEYDFRIKGSPNFNNSYFTKETLSIDGVTYKDALLFYDLVKDQVVVKHYNNILKIQLPALKVDSFSCKGHKFVNLNKEKISPRPYDNFYDLLYNGKTKLYAKRIKFIEESRSNYILTKSFSEKNHLYFYKDSILYQVKSKSSALKVLKEKKKDIKSYLRKNKISFSNDLEKALISVLFFYDNLTN